VFPLRDLNPTRTFAVITFLLIFANAAVFFGWEPLSNAGEQAAFLYRHAAIACELTSGHALTVGELRSATCIHDGLGPALFPGKVLVLSVLVSLFLHANVIHLAGNMWFLWIFGNNVEDVFGRAGYLALYLVAGVVATIGFVLTNPGSTDPMIGASGAIAGILGAYLVLFPRKVVLSLVVVFVVPVPAFVFLGLWFVGQFMVGGTGVAWQAHVAGFLFGVLATFALRDLLRSRRRHDPPWFRRSPPSAGIS
jgi:membrane associated rhomboid family serine protease